MPLSLILSIFIGMSLSQAVQASNGSDTLHQSIVVLVWVILLFLGLGLIYRALRFLVHLIQLFLRPVLTTATPPAPPAIPALPTTDTQPNDVIPAQLQQRIHLRDTE
jgi:hypothetical protein